MKEAGRSYGNENRSENVTGNKKYFLSNGVFENKNAPMLVTSGHEIEPSLHELNYGNDDQQDGSSHN